MDWRNTNIIRTFILTALLLVLLAGCSTPQQIEKPVGAAAPAEPDFERWEGEMDEREKAIASYRKSLELDPANHNAGQWLEKLL